MKHERINAMTENDKFQRLKWKMIKRRLGYTSDELEKFKSNPKNEELMDRFQDLLNKRLIAQVVESHGCNSQHKVGDVFTFDVSGNLITEQCPKNICTFALHTITPILYAAGEFLYAGMDPNAMIFRRASCIDVGLQCGGWGQIVLELRCEDIVSETLGNKNID
jgi:uncharacterized repeat protein (TIGR04076 family)